MAIFGEYEFHRIQHLLKIALMAGAFVGNHNGVSPDMKQTYNADAKESSGLNGLNLAARMKWVYTKPLT